jgi:hypothetical protein
MARLRLLLAAVMLGTLFLVPATVSAARPSAAGITAPVTGTVDGVGSFAGQFNLTRVTGRHGQLVGIGTLTGTVTNALTGAVTQISQTLRLPLALTGTCDILHLELGPLDLNVLGLVIHLDRIVLDIDAQAGPGNLLGNLLCAVAHLLDGTGPFGGIAALLNRILRILG